jgi:translation initiation factor IF-1
MDARTMPDANLHAAGPILEQLGEVLYRAELPNGKPILAHLSKPLAQAGTRLAPGTLVVMELTPYDFDHARILRVADEADAQGRGVTAGPP